MAKLAIVVRFSFEGIHSWPTCPPDHPAAFLVHPHRHLFFIEATKAVNHAERDIEILDFRNRMLTFCEHEFCGPHTMSCETMATILLEHFGLSMCRVLEDNENGAEVTP